MPEATKRITDPIGWLVESVIEYGFEVIFRKYYGKYRGIVIDTNDPLKSGRVRVMVPDIGQVKPEDVESNVWAFPNGMMGGVFGQEKEVDGLWFPPDKGDFVWVEYERGDVTQPVYSKGFILDNKPKGISDLWSESNLVKGIRTKAGHLLKFMNKSGEESVSLVWGKDGKQTNIKIEMTKDGVNITTEKSKINLTDKEIILQNEQGTKVDLNGSEIGVSCSYGTVNFKSSGTTVTAKGNLKITAPQITLDTSSLLMGKNGVYEPIIQGSKFAQIFARHTHVAPSGGGPTAPPVEPIVPGNGLSMIVKTR